MKAYGPEHRSLRADVLAQEPWCPGYPVGIHDGEPVRAMQLDHRTPLIDGGATTRENVGGLCASCNGRKGRGEKRRSWRGR